MSTNDEKRKPSVLADLPRARPQLRSERRASSKPRAAKPAKPGPTKRAASGPSRSAGRPSSPPPPAPVAPPPPADQPIAKTALQAAGEIAHIGFAVGARALRNALDRLPKP
jgi:hypothetical protein